MPTFIADLPPELLQHIFSFYVERWHRNILTSEEAAEWDTTLMSVCQLWKKLVLSHPALWAYIPLPFPPARMSTHLERSADHPLTVFTPAASRYGYMEVFSPATVDLLAKCMDRLEALSVRTGMNNLRLLLERQSVAPLLKSLVLDTGTDTLPSTTIDSQAISFVSSCCPNLTRLHICWSTPFPEIEFPVGLRTLDLRATGSGEFPIERLAPLRNLTHLTLKGTYVPYARLNEPGEPEEADAFVDLPSLKTLRMGDSSFFTIGRTLARLEIPPLLNLSIVNGRLSYRDKYAADELDEICETFSWMSQMIDGATDALVLSFAGTTLNLDWKRTWSDESEPSVIQFACFMVGRRYNEDNDAISRSVLVRICQAFRSESLRRVEVKFAGAGSMMLWDWRDTFASPASVPNLEVLVVENVSWTLPLMTALQSIDENDEDLVAGQIPFPALKHLVLKRFEFDGVRSTKTDPGVKQLIGMLTRRKELGTKVNELVLEKCRGLTAADYDYVKDLVGNLQVLEKTEI